MALRCRCRWCGARNTKKREPKGGIEAARCRHCHKRGTLRIDQWAQRRGWLARGVCRCNGVPFPHRPQMHGYITHLGGEMLAWCCQVTDAQWRDFEEQNRGRLK